MTRKGLIRRKTEQPTNQSRHPFRRVSYLSVGDIVSVFQAPMKGGITAFIWIDLNCMSTRLALFYA